MRLTVSACLPLSLVLLLLAPLTLPQGLHAQGPPPPQILQDGLIPSDLFDLYTALDVRSTPDAPLHARAPSRAMKEYHDRWAGFARDEASFHAGEDFGTIRTLGTEDFRVISRAQGRYGELVVRQEESPEEGFDRWVYYTYVDGRPMGMSEVFQPAVSVSVARDGSEGRFVLEDPDGLTGAGYFSRAGWEIRDGRTVHWIEGTPEPAFAATVLRYHEEGSEAVGHFLNSSGELLGELRYDRANGAGSFTGQGESVCWDAAMQNVECVVAPGGRDDGMVPWARKISDDLVRAGEWTQTTVVFPLDGHGWLLSIEYNELIYNLDPNWAFVFRVKGIEPGEATIQFEFERAGFFDLF